MAAPPIVTHIWGALKMPESPALEVAAREKCSPPTLIFHNPKRGCPCDSSCGHGCWGWSCYGLQGLWWEWGRHTYFISWTHLIHYRFQLEVVKLQVSPEALNPWYTRKKNHHHLPSGSSALFLFVCLSIYLLNPFIIYRKIRK